MTDALPTCAEVAKLIDHSLLKPTFTTAELRAGCELAVRYGVASVCILPYAVPLCAEILGTSGVLPSTTIGFPHGGEHARVKAREAEQALDDGARELDMVVNIGAVLSGDDARVRADIAGVLELVRARGQKLKVIFETCYLNTAQKVRLCEISGELGVDWVKTSTGFGTAGATLEDVTLLRRHSPAHVAVKASGGIVDLDSVLRLRAAGATRIGSSRTAEILDHLRQRLERTHAG
jgi:deoxyribose-phosphate aldolase